MNANELEKSYRPEDRPFDLVTILDDLEDPRSDWYALYITELSGYDYVFAPKSLCSELTSICVLNEFMLSLNALVGSELDRIILLSYEDVDDEKRVFDRFHLDSTGESIIDAQRVNVAKTEQQDFVQTLLDHSAPLISSDATH